MVETTRICLPKDVHLFAKVGAKAGTSRGAWLCMYQCQERCTLTLFYSQHSHNIKKTKLNAT
jgi:hypothetical protein